MSKTEIFVKAWALAKAGAAQFGGSSKEYFAESLKIVYANSHVYVLDIQTSHNRPAWCARITGLSKHYGFKREFVGNYGSGRWELKDGIYNYGRGKGDADNYVIVNNGKPSFVYDDDVKLMFA